MFLRKLLFLIGLSVVVLLAACSQTQPTLTQPPATEETAVVEEPEPTEAVVEAEEAHESEEHAIHWGYEGEGGPDHWADLDSDYAACGAGVEQSPIDIPPEAPVNADNLAFHYEETAVNILNNGHAIQVNYDEGSSVEIDGEAYNLLQFHFHGPSEHALDGNLTDMEMHLVHQNADGGLAVVGVMLVEGEENPAYAPVFDNVPAEAGDPMMIDGAVVNVDDLLPTERTYYRYEGSLTTPPCSEGVKWHVMSEPVELSAEQIAAFTAVMEPDNRPVQPMNDREFITVGEMAEGDHGEEAHAIHWGYEGEGGPEHWADLDADYAACTGVEQSPIDITNAASEDLMDIVFNYSETAVNILNNGHTIQVNYDEGSSIEIDGKTYDLKQFHFHTPSEHALDGELAAGEMHLVHQSEDGSYAVVGVMIMDGAENPAFINVWDNFPDHVTEAEMVDGVTVNASDLLPETRTYFNYSGSFTTPPCTEGVNWLVLTTPIEMSADQIAAFSSIVGDNNRPTQPLGERTLVEDNE